MASKVPVLDLARTLDRSEDLSATMLLTPILHNREARQISWDFFTRGEFAAKDKQSKSDAFRVVTFDSAHHRRSKNALATTVEIPSLSKQCYEAWTASGSVKIETQSDITIRTFGGMMLSTLHGFENSRGLQKTAFELYRNFFALLKAYPDQKLMRMWNYVPKILAKNGTLERYHQFNMGRYKAWQQYGPKDADGEAIYPAATGIGSHGGLLTVEVLTTCHPVHHLQNPRQTPAHIYSKKYGPLPPVFSRATLHLPPSGPELYIAGTASIIGEDVLWIDDPVLQSREALKNIEILMSDENLSSVGHKGFTFQDLSGVRVYIKHPKHLPLIKREVERLINPEAIIYLHDDICRKEWLLEIEGIARKR